tara:strand:- start:261 stop:497 length:237 start_codon:yes stop_codon:yes gene_type:complete
MRNSHKGAKDLIIRHNELKENYQKLELANKDLKEQLRIADVSQQRELLIAMLEWGTKENMVQQDLNNEQIVDLYLSNL